MYSSNPITFFKECWRNRNLIKQLVQRDVIGRYQGTHLGILWVVLEPLLMLTVYTIVFRIIFDRHWYSQDETVLEFSIILFSGLLVFNIFRETVNIAPRLVLRNINYVKKVVFPLELLSVVSILSGIIHLFISLLILLTVYMFVVNEFHATILYAPIILLPFVFFLLGTSFFLSSLGVYIRDLGQVIGMVVMACLFLSAIFYPIEIVPEQYRIWFYVNPVAFTVEQFRGAIIWGREPQWLWLLSYYAVSLLISWFGYFWFQKTRKGFADVL